MSERMPIDINQETVPYLPFEGFVLRSPLFPLAFLHEICGSDPWDESLAHKICDQAEIREALRLASPDLYAELRRWQEGKLTEAKAVKRFYYSLLRYAVRLSSRCTPFGLFAGFTPGKLGAKTDICLQERFAYSRHTRLDMHFLCALALDLAKKPDMAAALRYFPNSSLHRVGDQYRYVEYRYLNKRRTHHIVAVDHTEYLERVLRKAESGTDQEALVDLLLLDEVDREEALSYLGELIENQVLVHSLEPTLTGPEFIRQVLDEIKPVLTEEHHILQEIDACLADIDRSPLGDGETKYAEISEKIKTLGTPFEAKFLFQTDMVKPAMTCTIDATLAEDLVAAMPLLNRLTERQPETRLSQFRFAFVDRYEQRQIPLLVALDTEMGVGYQQGGDMAGDVAPLVDDLHINSQSGSQTMPWSRVDSLLFEQYQRILQDGAEEWVISDEVVKDLPLSWDDLPGTLSVMVHMIQEPGSLRPTLICSGLGGNAGNLLGRFCHADDETHDLVRRMMAEEAALRPDVIMAEIAHLPEARLGNILLRPVLRDYEIPYLGRSAVDADHQIRLDDLLVSVRGDRVILHSRKLGKEIVPRLTSAHNFSMNALPIYHFLCDLQNQNLRPGLFFTWGSLAGSMPWLPRVRYRNLILHPASWQIKKKEIEPLLAAGDDDTALMRELTTLRERRHLPWSLSLADGDNELFVHFNNLLAVRNLLAQVKGRSAFKLVEYPFELGDSPVQSADGVFANEVVISFHRQPAKQTEPKEGDRS
jgi:hypothetical protein